LTTAEDEDGGNEMCASILPAHMLYFEAGIILTLYVWTVEAPFKCQGATVVI